MPRGQWVLLVQRPLAGLLYGLASADDGRVRCRSSPPQPVDGVELGEKRLPAGQLDGRPSRRGPVSGKAQLAPDDTVHEAVHVGHALILVLPDGIRFEIVCKKLVCPQRVLLLPPLLQVVSAVVFKPDAGAAWAGKPQDDVGPSDVGLVEPPAYAPR